jgi:hypothetical protein
MVGNPVECAMEIRRRAAKNNRKFWIGSFDEVDG